MAKTRAGLDRLLTEQAGGEQGVAAALKVNELTATPRADAGVVFTDGDSQGGLPAEPADGLGCGDGPVR